MSAIEQRLEQLEAAVENIKSCECNCEETLKNYLTKDDASTTYVTIETYNSAIRQLQDAISDLINRIGTLPEGETSVVGYVSDTETTANSAVNKAYEALVAAEAANASASNAQQLLANVGPMAQYTYEKVEQIEANVSAALENAIEQTETAVTSAENAAKKAEQAEDECNKIANETKNYVDTETAALWDALGDLGEGETVATLIQDLESRTKTLEENGGGGGGTMQDYVLQSDYDAQTGYSAAELAAKGTIKQRLDNAENDLDFQTDPTQMGSLAWQIAQKAKSLTEDEVKAIVNAAMSAKPKYQLPYSAADLTAKLSKL